MATSVICNQAAMKWQNSFARLNRDKQGIAGLIDFSEAWILAKEWLRPRGLQEAAQQRAAYNTLNKSKLRSAFHVLSQCRMLPALLEDFLEDMRRQLPLIAAEIQHFMSQYESDSRPEIVARLIHRIALWYQAWAPLPELGQTVIDAFTSTFLTQIYCNLPPTFSPAFKCLIRETFNFTTVATAPPWLLELFPRVGSTAAHAPRPDYRLWVTFEQLGLIERYESLISSVCYEYIENHITKTYSKVWDKPCLKPLRDWMADTVIMWLVMPYARNGKTPEEVRGLLQGIGSRLDYHVCKTLADLRTAEIFDIIIDFPESRSALDDLKDSLNRVDSRSQLVASLRKANRRRLLHPGADTKLILTQYVSIIRCLRIIDPQGVLLFKVADPIRRYLRDRPDTIRCIVASLVGDGESGDSLVDENEPIQPLQQAQIDDFADPNWEPEPIDAGPEFRTNKPSDIISTLVSIYDSQELFVKELQVLLAQRLLAIKDGNFDRERRNIEILKIRFGEAALQVCEVMLRDMTDSKRIDQHIQNQKNSLMHPTIISRHFWPPLQTNTFIMPGQFKDVQEGYAKEFVVFKPDKKLVWMSHLGSISLDIELDDRTVSADVPPLEAAFIELFSEQEQWTVAELMEKVGLADKATATKALVTWVDLGVLREDEPGQYRLLNTAEPLGSTSKNAGKAPAAAVEELPPVVTVQQQQAEQMRIFWKFIEGMLKNLGTLSLDRIQQMLKFAPGYNRNIEQLGAFMEAARREGLVTVKDGMWKLQKP